MSWVGLPFSWLRGLGRAMKTWLGTVRAARQAWECHRIPLDRDLTCTLQVPPPSTLELGVFGEFSQADRARIEVALSRPRQRLIEGAGLGALVDAAHAGALVHARLQDGSEPSRPAVLTLHRSG